MKEFRNPSITVEELSIEEMKKHPEKYKGYQNVEEMMKELLQ